MKKQETKIERTAIDMAKAKTMIGNALLDEMIDNLSDAQIVLYVYCMRSADCLGLVSGKGWMRSARGSEEDLKALLDLGYLIEIKQKRAIAYVVSDWWKHNSLPARRLRKTTMVDILAMLHVQDRIYNLDGDGVPAAEWLQDTKDDDEDEIKTPKKQDKKPEPTPHPLVEELMAAWNCSYPDKIVKHKPGTKIYDSILSASIYAGEENAKAAAGRSGCEMACEAWFNFDTIFSDADKILKMKNGSYDKAFGYVAQKLEQEKRETEKAKPKSLEEQFKELGF